MTQPEPTPLTDAQAVDLSYLGKSPMEECHVPVDFARTLERELNEARAERDSETKWAKHYLAGLEQAEARCRELEWALKLGVKLVVRFGSSIEQEPVADAFAADVKALLTQKNP